MALGKLSPFTKLNRRPTPDAALGPLAETEEERRLREEQEDLQSSAEQRRIGGTAAKGVGQVGSALQKVGRGRPKAGGNAGGAGAGISSTAGGVGITGLAKLPTSNVVKSVSAEELSGEPTIDEGATYRAYMEDGGGYGDVGGATSTTQPMGSLELGQTGGPGGTTPGGFTPMPMGGLTIDQQMISGLLDAGYTPDEITQVLQGIELGGSGGPVLPDGSLAQGTSGMSGAGGGGLGGSSNTLGQIGGGLGSLASLYGLYNAFTGTGDPGMRALQGLQSAYGAYSGANTALGLNLPTVSSGLSALMGGAGAGIGSGTGAAAAAGAAPASVGAAAMGGSTAGGAATGVGPATAAGGVGVGAVAAPIAAMLIASAISGLAGGDDPFGRGIGDMLAPLAGRYPKFVPELMQNVGQQNTAFGVLGQGLPYVQSKEELGQLLNSYRNYLGTTTGITPENWGSIEGAPSDVYSIGKIPGVGPRTHGQATTPVDFGPQTQALWRQIEALYPLLPGSPISAGYGQPGGGLEGEAGMRLMTQFQDRQRVAPLYSRGVPGEQIAFENGSPVFGPGITTGFYDPYRLADVPGGLESGIQYGSPGYDYAGSGFPEPGKYFGQPSSAWAKLAGGGTGSAGRATATSGGGLTGGAPGISPQGSTGFASLLGPLEELQAADDPNRL